MNNLPIETYESVVQQRDALEKKLADVVAENTKIVGWIFEDELPKNYPYDAMCPHSKVDVVRMFPVFAPSSAQPVIPEEKSAIHRTKEPEDIAFNNGFAAGWNCCRSEVISLNETTAQPVSEPYKLPSGYALVPCKLTAENGAKSCMIGEFTEQTEISCPECFGDDECETCDGSGMIEVTVPVSWTTIKDIWAKGIEHFAAAPAQEQK